MKKKKKAIYYYRRAALIIWWITGIVATLVTLGMIFGIVLRFASIGTYMAAVKTLIACAGVSLLDYEEMQFLFPKR